MNQADELHFYKSKAAQLQEELDAWRKTALPTKDESDNKKVAMLKRAFAMRGTSPARLALLLYRNTDPVSNERILAGVPCVSGGPDTRDAKLVTVWIHHLRHALGFDAVVNSHGFGYYLSDEGRKLVQGVIG